MTLLANFYFSTSLNINNFTAEVYFSVLLIINNVTAEFYSSALLIINNVTAELYFPALFTLHKEKKEIIFVPTRKKKEKLSTTGDFEASRYEGKTEASLLQICGFSFGSMMFSSHSFLVCRCLIRTNLIS